MLFRSLGVLLPNARCTDCLGALFYVESPCVASVGLIVFGVRVVLSIDVCQLFPQGMLAIIPFIGGVTDVVVIRACTGY